MSSDENGKSFGLEKSFCTWCINPLTLQNSFENAVCLDCYQQLIRAGLSDEKIFDYKVSGSSSKDTTFH